MSANISMVLLLSLINVIGPNAGERNVYLSLAVVVGVEKCPFHNQVKNSERKTDIS